MRNNYIGGKNNHSFLLVTLIMLVTALLFTHFYFYANYIALPIIFLWIPYVLNKLKLLNKTESALVKVSFLILAEIFIYRIIGLSDLNIGYLIRQFEWILAGIISIFALRCFSNKELKTLFIAYTIVLFVYLLLVVRVGNAFLNSSYEEMAVSVTGTWVGSMFMLLAGFCLIVFLHIKKTNIRVIATLLFLLIVYVNFYILQRGTIIILMAIEFSLILIFIGGSTRFKTVIISIILLTLFFVLSDSDIMIQLFDFLAEAVPSERLSKRFQELAIALQYESIEAGGGSFAARGNLIGVSWHTFTSSISHFIMGAGAHKMNNLIIGNHSFFIDTLASYGIIGGVLIAIYFVKQYQIMMTDVDIKNHNALYMQCAVVFLFYIIRNFYGFLATAQCNFMVLLYFPLIIRMIFKYSNKPQMI